MPANTVTLSTGSFSTTGVPRGYRPPMEAFTGIKLVGDEQLKALAGFLIAERDG